MEKIEVRVLKPFAAYAEGAVVAVAVDEDGTPLDAMWRRRLKDAELDQCCVIESTNTPSRAPKRRDSK